MNPKHITSFTIPTLLIALGAGCGEDRECRNDGIGCTDGFQCKDNGSGTYECLPAPGGGSSSGGGGGSSSSSVGGSSPNDVTKDELFAQMQAVVDWGVSASNAYEDAELTVQVSNGSTVEAFMGFGNDMPDPSNLYLVSPDFVVADLWFGNEGVKSRYWDKGAYDHFLNIHNTFHVSYETNPGQVSGLSGDTDQIYMFRLWHGTFWESVALGAKWMGDNTLVFYGQNGEVFESAPVEPNFGTDYTLRLTYKTSDLSIKVYLNGEEIISDNLVAPRDIREFSIGTNSHPLAQHFRFYGLKRGEFTAAELATRLTSPLMVMKATDLIGYFA